jgi:hypothetical protein
MLGTFQMDRLIDYHISLFQIVDDIHIWNISGWWFGTWTDCFSTYWDIFIIPTDGVIFFSGVGWNHQPDIYLKYIYIYINYKYIYIYTNPLVI